MPAPARPTPPGAIGSALAAASAVRPTKAEPKGLSTSSASSTAAPPASLVAAASVTQAKSVGVRPMRASRFRRQTPGTARRNGTGSSHPGRRPAAAPAAQSAA
jgi:hypothetical protein